MAASTAPRIEWAASVVASRGPSRVLELGCGNGNAVAALARLLPDARVVAVDRSVKAIEAASRRNRELIEVGRVRLVNVAIAKLTVDLHESAFDAVFAVNVNVFWLEPAAELLALRSLLAPGAELLLFYEPPSKAQGKRIADSLLTRLPLHGFEVIEELRRPLGGAQGVAVFARPALLAARH